MLMTGATDPSPNRLKTYRIKTKAFYGAISDDCYEEIRASTCEEALKELYRCKRVAGNPDDPSTWTWWEGDWLLSFRTINEIEIIQCPVCGGIVEKIINVG
jgi:hypothetical protein